MEQAKLSIRDFTPLQQRVYESLRTRTCAFVWLGVGGGKTAVTGAACEFIRARYKDCGRVLVLGTRSLLTTTWPKEFEKWAHFEGVTYAAACNPRHKGSMNEAKRREVVESMPDYLGVNYESLRWFFETYGDTEFVPRVLVIDEVTYMKSHSTKRFHCLRDYVGGVPEKLPPGRSNSEFRKPGSPPWFRRRFGLTATPAPERYTDLWSQLTCVSIKPRLGKNITGFRARYCTSRWTGERFEYVIQEYGKRQIEQAIEPITINEPGEPDKAEFFSIPVGWTDEGREEYDRMEKSFIAEVTDAVAGGKTVVQAASVAVSLNKMRQMCGGFVYETGDTPKETKSHEVDPLKLDALEELIDSLAGEAPLIFYQFGWELEAIRKRLDVCFTMNDKNIMERWAAHDWDHHKRVGLALHPKSAGHGVDGLQHGTSVGIWYSLPWSAEQYLQANGRIAGGHRNHGNVRLYRLMRENSVDEDVYDKLTGKLASNAGLLDRVGRRQKGK